jgi:ribosome maturation factor RimP
LLSFVHHISPAWRNGRAAPIFSSEGKAIATNHDRERSLQREISQRVESGIPGVEVLAVELTGPDRFCVYVDHPAGVDHALCVRVTDQLRDYLNRFTIEVSSPGLERPLRKPTHFANVIGRKVAVRTAAEIAGRKRFRGELVDAGEGAVTVQAGDEAFDIPYDVIVRGNLIDER